MFSRWQNRVVENQAWNLRFGKSDPIFGKNRGFEERISKHFVVKNGRERRRRLPVDLHYKGGAQ